MIYKISVLRGTKTKPELIKVTEILADCFVVDDSSGSQLFHTDASAVFYNIERHFWSPDERVVVACLPRGEWVIEQA
jgi:hypothetical protein